MKYKKALTKKELLNKIFGDMKSKKSVDKVIKKCADLLAPPPLPESLIHFLKKQDLNRANGDDIVDIIDHCDEWAKKEVLSHPHAKRWLGDVYPFKDYVHVYAFLDKYGHKFIDELSKKCPVKYHDRHHVMDSVALVIFKNTLDPWSFVKIPSNQSLWDKISEEGQV